MIHRPSSLLCLAALLGGCHGGDLLHKRGPPVIVPGVARDSPPPPELEFPARDTRDLVEGTKYFIRSLQQDSKQGVTLVYKEGYESRIEYMKNEGGFKKKAAAFKVDLEEITDDAVRVSFRRAGNDVLSHCNVRVEGTYNRIPAGSAVKLLVDIKLSTKRAGALDCKASFEAHNSSWSKAVFHAKQFGRALLSGEWSGPLASVRVLTDLPESVELAVSVNNADDSWDSQFVGGLRALAKGAGMDSDSGSSVDEGAIFPDGTPYWMMDQENVDEATPTAYRVTPTAPQMPPAAPQMTPTAPQMPPAAPRMPPTAPRMTPTAPRMTPTAPRMTPTAPRMTPTAPRMTPTAPGMTSAKKTLTAVQQIPAAILAA